VTDPTETGVEYIHTLTVAEGRSPVEETVIFIPGSRMYAPSASGATGVVSAFATLNLMDNVSAVITVVLPSREN
jgi:hypothetical protein